MTDPQFVVAFEKAKTRIRLMQSRYVEEAD